MKKDIKMLAQPTEMTHKGFRKVAAGVAKFLNVELDQPDFLPLIQQYCEELQLPSTENYLYIWISFYILIPISTKN